MYIFNASPCPHCGPYHLQSPGECICEFSSSRLQIHSRYEFFDEIRLSRLDRQYISADSETPTDQKYKLLSVVVHKGTLNRGHYNAYIRPDGKTWYVFDDETVTLVDQGDAIEGQFGENTPILRVGGVDDSGEF
jgi:hypothetical protein